MHGCFASVSLAEVAPRSVCERRFRHSKFDKRSPPWFRVVCFECRKLGLGRSGVQRVRVARLRARDRAWKYQCFGRSLKLVRQGASDEVARLRREQPRAKRGLLRQVIVPVTPKPKGDAPRAKPSVAAPPRTVGRRRCGYCLRFVVSLALVLSSRRQLAAEGAFAPLPSYRTPAYLAVQGKGCALAAKSLGHRLRFRSCLQEVSHGFSCFSDGHKSR